MKKSAVLIIVGVLLLMFAVHVSAQDQADPQNALPELLEPIPDPAQILGSVGSAFQQNVDYYGSAYDTYLFPRPDSPEVFLSKYIREAIIAGYMADTDVQDGYSVLRIYDAGDRNTTALLFPDYQGYLFLMVPPSIRFELHSEVPEELQPGQLIEMGSAAISNRDYQTAVRYLIKAAGALMQTEEVPQPTETPELLILPTNTPTEMLQPETDQVYKVQDGDSCWSIAAQFGLEFQDFMDANNFTECNLFIDDEVIIPGRVERTPTPTPLPGAQRTYTVQAGDSCWSIAVNNGVNFELFMSVNHLTECNIIIGDDVIIPGADDQMPTPTPIPLDQYTTGQQIRYTVEMNDSYNDIAAKFNTTLVSIQQLNNVNVYTGFPQYGQVLTIAVNLVTPTPAPEASETPQPGTLEP